MLFKQPVFTLSPPKAAKVKIRKKLQISFSKILKKKKDGGELFQNTFHLNGHTIGFSPQTQKLEPPYEISSLALGVIGLILLMKWFERKFSNLTQ